MHTDDNNPRQDVNSLLISLALGLAGVIIFMRFSVAAGLGFLLAHLIGVCVYFWPLLRETITPSGATVDQNGFSYRVGQRLQDCEEKELRFRSEAENIRLSIVALREDVARSAKAGEDEKARANELIREFEAEFNLRLAKAAFFADCAAKLRELLDRHRLHESIATRKRELDELRRSNFDDEAALEETRYHLEQDTIQLDTIAELTKDISVSFKAEQAEELRAKLEKLRTSL